MSAFSSRLREVVDELEAVRKALLDSVLSLSQADLDFTPSADRWSIGEILHHLRLMEDSAIRVLEKLADRASGGHSLRGSHGCRREGLHLLDLPAVPLLVFAHVEGPSKADCMLKK